MQYQKEYYLAGERLLALRKARGLSRKALSLASGVCQSSLYSIEYWQEGQDLFLKRGPMTVPISLQLANALGTTPQYLLFGVQ